MNTSELRTYCLEHAGEELPAEAEALLASDPELKQEVDALITVQKLVSLKRYERPDPNAAERCVLNVSEEIAKRRFSPAAILREWFDFEPAAVRYAAAAAALVVCALGVGILSLQQSPSPNVAASEPDAPAPQIVPEPVKLAPTPPDQFAGTVVEDQPRIEKPIIMLRVESNTEPRPSGMTIGGSPVMPVSFEP